MPFRFFAAHPIGPEGNASALAAGDSPGGEADLCYDLCPEDVSPLGRRAV